MNTDGYWLVRCQGEFFVDANGGNGDAPSGLFPSGKEVGFAASVPLPLPLPVGSWLGKPCFAIEIGEPTDLVLGAGFQRSGIRAVFGMAGAEAFALVGRASLLLDWQKNHRFCGRCATPTERKPAEFAMLCPNCGLLAYPRISPAVMVLIGRGQGRKREFLLARSPHFREGMFSALAGFVEAGETLEQAAVREVREEVGVEIANLRYFHSQPWPFPDSLMLAFFADYAGGEIQPQPGEIEAAGWFAVDELPLLPNLESIARRLIEAAISETRSLV